MVAGVLMKSLPVLAPSWFPGTGSDGTSASAIWLDWMGRIEVLLGSYYLVKTQLFKSLQRAASGRNQRPRGEAVTLATVQTNTP